MAAEAPEAKEQQEEKGSSPEKAKLAAQMCEECRENPFKYKCPGCGLRSCSLPCVKAHKERTRCTGKRDRTQFVPLSQFDDNWLISDYNLLEEVSRSTEVAKRSRAWVGKDRRSGEISGARKHLFNQARNRKTQLLLLPKGMSKSEANKSFYNIRCKCIYWTVEWQFHLTDVTFIDHKVDEHLSLQGILEKHLTIGPGNPVTRHKLRHFCNESIENLKLFIKKQHTRGNKKLYFQLNVKEPLRSQLAGKAILEFPVIHVALPSNATEFELCKGLNPVCEKVVKPSKFEKLDDLGHQEGVPFREEEIEEGELPLKDFDPVPEKLEKSSNKHSDCLHLEDVLFREVKGESEHIKDSNPVPQEVINTSNGDEHDDVPLKEEDTEEGEIELTKDENPTLETVSRPSNIDGGEAEHIKDSNPPSNIDERESEHIKDSSPVTQEVVNTSNGEHDDVPLKEEDIEDGEIELTKDENPTLETVSRPSNFKVESEHIKDSNPVPQEIVKTSNGDEQDDVPLKEEDIEEGEIELIKDENLTLETVSRPSNFYELDDLVPLDDLAFRGAETDEGEFVPYQHFDGDFPLQVDMDLAMDRENDEL